MPSFARLLVPPEVAAACQAELRDVRLVSRDGRDVPYVVDRLDERVLGLVWTGRLVDTQSRGESRRVWVVDLDAAPDLRPDRSGRRRTGLRQAGDGGGLRRPCVVARCCAPTRASSTGTVGREDPPDGDLGRGGRHRAIPAADGRRRPSRADRGAWRSRARDPASAGSGRAAASRHREGHGARRERADTDSTSIRGFPVDAVEISADEPAFARRVRLIDVRVIGGRTEETTLGDARLYRLRIEDEDLAGESLSLAVRGGTGRHARARDRRRATARRSRTCV